LAISTNGIFLNIHFPSQYFLIWKIKFENFNISENIISVEMAKVLGYFELDVWKWNVPTIMI